MKWSVASSLKPKFGPAIASHYDVAERYALLLWPGMQPQVERSGTAYKHAAGDLLGKAHVATKYTVCPKSTKERVLRNKAQKRS